jgi:hypothetical protein
MAKKTIAEEIGEFAQQFETLAHDLFSVTRPLQLFDYENGVYGEMYFRLNKRLSKIFSTDREVLVLITNFPDQQQRTIFALKRQIAEAAGRVEATLAIVVHADSDGNRKLKMWGREKGITVLPILARDSFQDAATFERDLLLDFFANDPFDVTGPVSDDARFFGRRTEALDIARQLQGGQIRSSLGIRKIGKTSILNRILYEARVNHGSVCVMIDCSKDDIWEQSASELLYSISVAVTTSAGKTPHYAEVQQSCKNDGGLSDARKALLAAILATESTVILFFDEVDYITPGSPTARAEWTVNFNPFWRNLRAIAQEAARSEKKFSLFVCGVSSKWFKEESIDGVENAALSFIPEEYLSPLAPLAISGMIRSISRTAGLSFDDTTAELIGQACGNMPYWTRKACSYIHRNIDVRDRPCTVQRETAQRLVGEFVEEEGAAIAEVALNHLFRVHPEVFAPARSVFDGGKHVKSEQFISTLIRYGLLAEVAGTVVLGSGMIREGMKLCIQKRSAIEAVLVPVDEPSSLILKFDEWADELALINASRNKLEKRLRALALNFIKFSTLQNKNKGTTASRVIRCVEKIRTEKIQHLPADDLIEKLLWSELVRLVEKEWDLFIPNFADLRLFKEHATILNDRMDAHAKNADGADLAFYRRSLRWLEEAVQKASA